MNLREWIITKLYNSLPADRRLRLRMSLKEPSINDAIWASIARHEEEA